MAARDDDFLGDGTVDPFTGLAPALTPEEEQRRLDARRAQLRALATRTGNTNAAQDRTSGTGAPLGSGGGAAEAESCILDKIRGWRFPSSSAGGGTYAFPFNFTR